MTPTFAIRPCKNLNLSKIFDHAKPLSTSTTSPLSPFRSQVSSESAAKPSTLNNISTHRPNSLYPGTSKSLSPFQSLSTNTMTKASSWKIARPGILDFAIHLKRAKPVMNPIVQRPPNSESKSVPLTPQLAKRFEDFEI